MWSSPQQSTWSVFIDLEIVTTMHHHLLRHRLDLEKYKHNSFHIWHLQQSTLIAISRGMVHLQQRGETTTSGVNLSDTLQYIWMRSP